jgi:hypothetical protein
VLVIDQMGPNRFAVGMLIITPALGHHGYQMQPAAAWCVDADRSGQFARHQLRELFEDLRHQPQSAGLADKLSRRCRGSRV